MVKSSSLCTTEGSKPTTSNMETALLNLWSSQLSTPPQLNSDPDPNPPTAVKRGSGRPATDSCCRGHRRTDENTHYRLQKVNGKTYRTRQCKLCMNILINLK